MKLEFLANEANEDEGLGDAGIETFRASPFSSCAREIGQNSRDAGVGAPIRLTFNVLGIPRGEIPDIEALAKSIGACLDKARQRQKEKEIDFFERAKQVVAAPIIRVLEVADYNTTGLVGPAEEGRPFNSLLKGSGTSEKKDADSGGSFGIGKNASFAVSALQTVLYSTLYQEGSGLDFLCQGKTILVSHQLFPGKDGRKRAKGYWGAEDYQPVSNSADVPQWMRRTQRGTSIFILGFDDGPNWQSAMTFAIIQNFFQAIHQGDIVFEIDAGSTVIDREHLSALFSRADVVAAAEDGGRQEDLRFSSELYRVLTDPAASEEEITDPVLGVIKIRILESVGLLKKVGITRNGMLITDNLRNFNAPLASFPRVRDFIALVWPATKAGSEVFKKLESPSHNEFSADRITDPTKRTQYTKAMRRLGKEIRERIRAKAGSISVGNDDVSELTPYFQTDGERRPEEDGKGEPSPTDGQPKPVPKRPPRKPPVQSDNGDEGGSEGGSRNDSEGGSKGSGGEGSSGAAQNVGLINVRAISARNDSSWRRIYLTADRGGQMRITLRAAGMQSDEPLSVIDVEGGKLASGHPIVDLEAGVRSSILVRFSEKYDGPLEIHARMQGD